MCSRLRRSDAAVLVGQIDAINEMLTMARPLAHHGMTPLHVPHRRETGVEIRCHASSSTASPVDLTADPDVVEHTRAPRTASTAGGRARRGSVMSATWATARRLRPVMATVSSADSSTGSATTRAPSGIQDRGSDRCRWSRRASGHPRLRRPHVPEAGRPSKVRWPEQAPKNSQCRRAGTPS